jgi:hypothetical protein
MSVPSHFWIIPALLVCAANGCSASAEDITTQQAFYWQEGVNNGSLSAFIEFLGAQHSVEWPRVYSVDYRGSLSSQQKELHVVFRDVAKNLLVRLERVVKGIEGSDWNTFDRLTRSLIRFRDIVGARPSYVNLLITDCVNRLLFVTISRRVVEDVYHGEELASLLKSTRNYDNNIDSLASVSSLEYAVDMRSSVNQEAEKTLKALELSSDDTRTLLAFKLFALLDLTGEQFASKRMSREQLLDSVGESDFDALSLLNKQKVHAVLFRMYLTDRELNVSYRC